MSVPSIEKLTALQPWTVVGVKAGDLLDLLASAADHTKAVEARLESVWAALLEGGQTAEIRARRAIKALEGGPAT